MSKYKDILELMVKIANELDGRGLVVESDRMDSLIAMASDEWGSRWHDFGDTFFELGTDPLESVLTDFLSKNPNSSMKEIEEGVRQLITPAPQRLQLATTLDKLLDDGKVSFNEEEDQWSALDVPMDESDSEGGELLSWEDAKRKTETEQETTQRIMQNPGRMDEEEEQEMADKMLIRSFLISTLGADAVYYDFDGYETPLHLFLNDDGTVDDQESITDYILHVVPDGIADLALEIGSPDPNELKDRIFEEAKEMEEYKEDDKFASLVFRSKKMLETYDIALPVVSVSGEDRQDMQDRVSYQEWIDGSIDPE